MEYNYYNAVKEDVTEYIKNEIDFADFDTIEDLEEYLNETLWNCDSVTGNASGSYTFNSWKAEEYLCHNFELLVDAFREFSCDLSDLEKGAETCDVIIRCYLLGGAISEALSKIENDFNEAHEEKEEEE